MAAILSRGKRVENNSPVRIVPIPPSVMGVSCVIGRIPHISAAKCSHGLLPSYTCIGSHCVPRQMKHYRCMIHSNCLTQGINERPVVNLMCNTLWTLRDHWTHFNEGDVEVCSVTWNWFERRWKCVDLTKSSSGLTQWYEISLILIVSK